MVSWYDLATDRPSAYAKLIYERFLERLQSYTGGQLTPELLRQHALRYLVPTIHLLKSPFALPNMAEAVTVLRAFIEKPASKKLVIYGDRDADGVTSASMLHLFCREHLKLSVAQVVTLVPLEEEKYGITPDVARRIVAEKPDLLITLDCGSSNAIEISEIQQQTGCATIIIDHHFIPPLERDYPQVKAFINPKLLSDFEFARDYCTAAITLRFLQAFLYSYTREYGETIGITDSTVQIAVRNGVSVENAEFSQLAKVYFLSEQTAAVATTSEKHDLLKLFEHTAREDYEMRRMYNFYQKYPAAFSLVEIFNAVQSASFRKSQAILQQYFPLAAIGLVADLMPVYADNRIIVREGLRLMGNALDKLPMGLAALLKKLNLVGAVSEQDLGFSVCPAINAAGRMGNAKLALEALTERDPLMAAQAAFRLTQINEQRKAASQSSLDLLDAALEVRSHTACVAVAQHEQFHRGISGLIASKIAEKLGKPALVIVPDGDCYRGSARAFRNENVHALIESASDHLIQFGGHKQAAGFSIAKDKLPQFIEAIFASAENILPSAAEQDSDDALIDPFRVFHPPLEIEPQSMRLPIWDELLAMAPYGVMNPHPVLAVMRPGKIEVASLGKTGDHAKLKFTAPADRNIEGVWFFHNGAAKAVQQTDTLVVSGEPQIGRFMGRTQYRLKITKVENRA